MTSCPYDFHGKPIFDKSININTVFTIVLGAINNFKRYCYNWLCGTIDQPRTKLTVEQRRALRAKLTSIRQTKFWRKALNAGAIVVATFTVFLIGFFF